MQVYKPLLIDYFHGKSDDTLWSTEPFKYRIIKDRLTDMINKNYLIIDAQIKNESKDRKSLNADPVDSMNTIDDDVGEVTKVTSPDNDKMNDINYYVRTQTREYVLGFLPTELVDDFCLKMYLNGIHSAFYKDPMTPSPDSVYTSNKLCFGCELYPFTISRFKKGFSKQDLEGDDNWEVGNKLTEEMFEQKWNRIPIEVTNNDGDKITIRDKSYTLVLCINPNWSGNNLFEIIMHNLGRASNDSGIVYLEPANVDSTVSVVVDPNTSVETVAFTN